MSLMKLAPESVRLRRMAKAYAAGEISEAEYRQARREVIDNFSGVPPVDDDTRPRWPDEPTLRSGYAPPAATAARRPAGSTAAAESSGSRRWLWLAALGLVAAATWLTVPLALGAEPGTRARVEPLGYVAPVSCLPPAAATAARDGS